MNSIRVWFNVVNISSSLQGALFTLQTALSENWAFVNCVLSLGGNYYLAHALWHIINTQGHGHNLQRLSPCQSFTVFSVGGDGCWHVPAVHPLSPWAVGKGEGHACICWHRRHNILGATTFFSPIQLIQGGDTYITLQCRCSKLPVMPEPASAHSSKSHLRSLGKCRTKQINLWHLFQLTHQFLNC